jgi:hypothetical protein
MTSHRTPDLEYGGVSPLFTVGATGEPNALFGVETAGKSTAVTSLRTPHFERAPFN